AALLHREDSILSIDYNSVAGGGSLASLGFSALRLGEDRSQENGNLQGQHQEQAEHVVNVTAGQQEDSQHATPSSLGSLSLGRMRLVGDDQQEDVQHSAAMSQDLSGFSLDLHGAENGT
ncbi:unnamed protein product, partial [Amoebophrya sp. A25]